MHKLKRSKSQLLLELGSQRADYVIVWKMLPIESVLGLLRSGLRSSALIGDHKKKQCISRGDYHRL